jgi:hypothetical protein
VFGNPGTTELPLIDALVDATDITYVGAKRWCPLPVEPRFRGRQTFVRRQPL